MDLNLSYTERQATRIFLLALGLDAALAAIYVLVHIAAPTAPWGPLGEWFDLDLDLSIPSWVATIQLFLVAAVLLLAARNNRRPRDLSSRALAAGGLLFLFLSADEGAGIHEKLTLVARKLDWNWLLLPGRQGAWIPIYAVLGLVLLAVSARHLLVLWRRFRRASLLALLGGALLVLGSVGAEVLGYLWLDARGVGTVYRLEVLCEEVLEMAGDSTLLYAALLLVASVTTAAPEAAGELAPPPEEPSALTVPR